MLLKNTSIDNFINQMKQNRRKIILFGTGVVAHSVMAYICEQAQIWGNICLALDNDRNKIGKTMRLGNKDIPIKPVEILKTMSLDNSMIIITGSHYYEMLSQLEEMRLGEIPCYILPIMCTSHLNLNNRGVIKESNNMLIPKKIHYMWFGSKELPKVLQACVDSWEKYCPDYEIIRWDETNYNIEGNLYTKQAYANRQWGFIPDYARLDILYHHGGIYLDTDVELLRSLDEMLYQKAFTSIEKWMVINIGGGTGSVVKHPAIKKMLDVRKNISFINADGSFNRMASGYYDTLPFLQNGYQLDGSNQSVNGMNIYGFDYFHSYDYMTGQVIETENRFAVHHFNGGWLSEESIQERKKAQRQYKKILKKMSI